MVFVKPKKNPKNVALYYFIILHGKRSCCVMILTKILQQILFHPQCQFQPDTLLPVDNLPLKWKKKMAQNYFFVFPAYVLCRFFWMNHKLISPKMSNFLPLTCVYIYQPFIKSNLFKKTNFSCKTIYVMYEYIKCFLWKCQIFKIFL